MRILQAISIHAPREGSDILESLSPLHTLISIHAPREGSDVIAMTPYWNVEISIHAPREGSDISPAGGQNTSQTFQSTLPVKGATAMLTNFSVTIVQLSANSTNFSL